MKKNTFNFLVLSGLLSSIIFSLLSCTFEITDKKRIADPDLISNESSAGIIVSLKNSNQDTLFVNIYRQDVTDYVNENVTINEPVLSVGIVFPYVKSNSTSNTTFVYEDNYVVTGHKYRYCARLYSEADGYTYTNWTPFFTAKSSLLAEQANFSYVFTQSTKFTYDDKAKCITVSGEIHNPTGLPEGTFEQLFTPALVFESSTGTKVFEIEKLENGSEIYLTSLLPLDFHNTDIKLIGVVGQRVFTTKEPKTNLVKTQKVVWTSLCPITLYDKNNLAISNNKIHLISEHGADGFDYSY